MPLERITLFCFEASYLVALVLEFMQLFQPRPILRLGGMVFGSAGLLAHTLFLLYQPLSLSSQFGSLLFLAWILAVFYLYGSIHHRNLAWAIFVLPVVLGLIGLADINPRLSEGPGIFDLEALRGERFWSMVHGGLLLLAGVGVCVGFLASVMYLIQARRLKTKAFPGKGIRLLSLERLEAMNRRAINLAFPLLTAGVLVGIALLAQQPQNAVTDWKDPKIWGAGVLWLVYAILLYLRYAIHVRGRQVALLTILAFGLLVFTLASQHTSVSGGPR
jgi:ABC-type transport system involved in cytochrome c biogenesis permease subunit